MKKCILTILGVLLCFGLAACAVWQAAPNVTEQSSRQEQSDMQNSAEASENQSTDWQESESTSSNIETPETGERKVKLTIDGQEFDAALYETPAANALYDMLPFELILGHFNDIEKIAYMDYGCPGPMLLCNKPL